MNDQAESLRRIVDDSSDVPECKVISVVSGKGGVGKSNFSLNFSIGLAQEGKKVILFDLDIGMANVDILMGVSAKYNIVDMIEHEMTIWDIIEEGPENISYISGGSGFTSIFKLSITKFERFIQQIEALQKKYDYIILDMGAGASEDSMQFILSAHETFIVTTPEPTSITDAYAMIKYIHLKDKELPCSLLINRIESAKEGRATAENLQRVAKQFLDKDLNLLGSLPNDKTVVKAVKSQKPFLLLDPKSKSSRSLKEIVKSYLGESQDKANPPNSSFISKFTRFFKER
ncbi:MinD/ParA family protein [Bacillus sp. FJAT-45350]|uniref:MinD/ParA family protein n=1 Tax=Bacillus sp. FJAT-45350 TaxID=2011014 RepID=UPI000BB681A2|nr:MinD/ParA family protein [Bacillus sp. FJAT-45350]